MPDFSNTIKQAPGEYDARPENNSAEQANLDDVDMSVLTDLEEAQCEGEPDLIVELIDLYLADVPLQLSAMKDFVLKSDAISLKRAAHNLSGSSANLGAKAIAKLCREMEQMDFSHSFQASNSLINQLEQAFASVSRIFSTERRNRV